MSTTPDAPVEPVPVDRLQDWVGRVQTTHDVATAAPLAALAALLDHDNPPWTAGEMPPLGHWLYFLKHERQSRLDRDGHPQRGDFLPPVALPRRMWAGSRVKFISAIPIGTAMICRSTISAVTAKQGRSGSMVFVKVLHEVSTDGSVALIEEQDIVYRSPSIASASTSPSRLVPHPAKPRCTVSTGPVALFRFSALTANAHRIHYDRDYARDEEGYPGLVVHGPFLATLLMDQYLRKFPGRPISSFNFRAERPVFDNLPFDLSCTETPSGAALMVVGPEGTSALSAEIASDQIFPRGS